ncbi:amidohydrolase family protein [Massilia glaciei]|nr:amidohydrolase family protein [Massilia glaciei]
MIKKLLFAGAACVALLLLLAAGLLLWPLPDMPRDGVEGDFVIRNVAVVDVGTGTIWQGRDVVLRDGKITSVGPAAPSRADDALIPIDGRGKYLMPGLWDMHTHSLKISPHYMHPLFIANGVTGVRDMSGCMSEPDSFFACIGDRNAWNKATKDRSGLSPRYVLQSSFQINGGNEVPDGFPGFFKARNAGEARQLVSFYRQAGANFLKPYSELSPVAYRALADEARRQGLTLAGHRPLRVSLGDLLAAGQRSVEHPRIFLQECHNGAAAVRARPDPLAASNAQLAWRLVNEHDRGRCAELMDAMAKSDTWWTPTLQVLQMGALAGNEAFRNDQRLRYIPFLFKKFLWAPDADRAARQPADASGRSLYATQYQMALGHVGQASSAGVKILAGTDAGDTYVFPGFGIHDELVELVKAGLSPAQALRSATLDAAIFSGLEDEFGSVTMGKTGDLILLDADPLADVRNTQRIAGLFFGGQFFDRTALDKLLGFAEERAGSVRTNLHLLWDGLNSELLRVQAAD